MHNKRLGIKPQNIPLSQGLYKQGNLHQQLSHMSRTHKDSVLTLAVITSHHNIFQRMIYYDCDNYCSGFLLVLSAGM